MASSSSSAGDTIYFYKASETPYGAFSQFYRDPFTVGDVTYDTAEMWMHMGKAVLFRDTVVFPASVRVNSNEARRAQGIQEEMKRTTDPVRHKRLGKEVRGFDKEVWDQHKKAIVRQGTMYKFTRGDKATELRALLLGTGDREIVEAAGKRDRVWGVGFTARDAEANRERWGENLLGKCLMEVREELRKQVTESEPQ